MTKKKDNKPKQEVYATQKIPKKNESMASLLPNVNKKYQLTPIDQEQDRGNSIASFMGFKNEENVPAS